MGARLLFLGVFVWTAMASAVVEIPPKSLPIKIVKTEIGEPQSNNQEGAPIENVRVFTPTGTIYFPVAPEDREKFNLRVQPVLEIGDEKIELPWMSAVSIVNYVNRIPSGEQVLVVQTENGAWAKAVPLGLVVDLQTQKITAAYQFLEWQISQNHMGHPDAAVIQLPIEEIGDRVFTRKPKLQLPDDWNEQQFFANYTGDKLVPLVVLAFEGAPVTGHKPGPLAPYIPSFKNKDHSALVVLRSELEDTKAREIGVYRMPVALLRTVSKVDLEALSKKAPSSKDSANWLQIVRIAEFRFDEQIATVDERHEEIAKHSKIHFAVASEFDLTPDACTTLIVREADKAKEE